MGIVNILKAVDPEVVVVGGRIVQSWDMIYPDLMNAVTERAFHARERTFTIVPTSLKVRPWLIGAATLAIREIFKDYQITV
jgi:predicted NBD/HSP70 family sugar kinase